MEYLCDNIFPHLIHQRAVPDDGQYESEKMMLLGEYSLKVLSNSAVYQSIRGHGFKYKVRKTVLCSISVDMVDYHIVSLDLLQERVSTLEFGEN